jgi:hypothetical protein
MSEIMYVVEMERECGSRYWSQPMSDVEVPGYIDKKTELGHYLSDVDKAATNV